MKNGIDYWINWIFVFPIAFFVCILVDFPIHWIIFIIHNYGGDSIFLGINPEVIERTIAPFFRGFLFVLISSFIAPSHNFVTGIIAAIIWILLTIALFLLAYFGAHFGDIQFILPNGGLSVIVGLIGAIVGLPFTYKMKPVVNPTSFNGRAVNQKILVRLVKVTPGLTLLIIGLLIMWVFRFWILGWSAFPGNIRFTAFLGISIGLTGLVFSPLLTFGIRNRKRALLLLAISIPIFIIFNFI